MSETYTIGGDTLYSCDNPTWAAQTFNPTYTHDLEYIDLELKGALIMPEPFVGVYAVDAFHHPTGDCLSRNQWTVQQDCNAFKTGRARFKMQRRRLYIDTEYCMVVSNDKPFLGNSLNWQYDAGDGGYTRGMRLRSPDNGVTWIDCPADDHIFAEFGTPPAPVPPPDPPIKNWAILSITYTDTATGIKIVVETNSPVHLWMRWTHEEPRKHRTPISLRGLITKQATRYCFVVFHDNEQAEPGDSLIHTFTKEPWVICQTRWFYFWGSVDGVDSPSRSAMFTKHRVALPFGPPETHFFYPDPHPEVTSVDGRLVSSPSPRPQSWDFIHNGTSVAPVDSSIADYITVYCDRYVDRFYQIARAIQLYDTSVIPAGSLITEAKLRILGDNRVMASDWPNAGIVVVSSNPAANTQLIAADWHTFGATPLTNTILQADYDPAGYNTFTFTEAGRAAIIAAGITKLGLIECGHDLPDIEPPWGSYRRVLLTWLAAENITPDSSPRLEVAYQPPL